MVESIYPANIVANGVTVATGPFQMEVGNTSLGPVLNVSALVSLVAGQTIVIQAFSGLGDYICTEFCRELEISFDQSRSMSN